MKSAGRYLDDVFSVDAFTDKNSLSYKSLEQKHQQKYPQDRIDQSEVAVYDSVNFIATALRSGASTGTQIREFLISADSIPSATGLVKFSGARDSIVPMTITRISNGICAEIPN